MLRVHCQHCCAVPHHLYGSEPFGKLSLGKVKVVLGDLQNQIRLGHVHHIRTYKLGKEMPVTPETHSKAEGNLPSNTFAMSH